ncbi:MAG: exopolysaccharide biosynthesis polyprenyl glycosylphosphotransferase [Cyanobium sp. LacPavin_0920_WC12_MAG_62_9]|nr:exopolysaccharide biosynthesis polyprenyl glycosylphosphotransferase [Cyanobium sp. LacPavin_0920_WC12_MAG_62_9]MCX5967594.1 exopolysaccharide biosynthesis polyprenyl glycosylphosphotransferase [Cyanobacteriota bacterium]
MQLRLPWLISRRRLFIAILIDCLLFGLSYGVVFQARFGVWPEFYLPLTWLLEVWLVASYVLGRYYDAKDASKAFFFRQCLGTLWTTLLSAAGYLSYHWLSATAQDAAVYRSFLLPFLLSFGLLSLLSQFALNEVLRNHLSESQKWLVLGTAEQAARLSSLLKWSRLHATLEHCPIGDFAKLADCQGGCSFVVPSMENLPAPVQPQLIQLQSNGFEILSVFGWSEKTLQRFPPELLTFSDLLRGEFSISKYSFQLRLKRLGDVGVSLILLVLSSPLLLVAALLIRLEDGGPIFYSQQRSGLNGQPFRVWKLRTMGVDAERAGAQWVRARDSRITTIGQFLRLTRIDELPQLWSVVMGEMSLIGPRPERPEFEHMLEDQIPHYRIRHAIRPGLSGWAQVNYPYGASIEDSANKLSYDLYYLRNFSFWLDVLILFKTMRLVFNARGAVPESF